MKQPLAPKRWRGEAPDGPLLYAYFLNKSFSVEGWSVLQRNHSQTPNLFPPESLHLKAVTEEQGHLTKRFTRIFITHSSSYFLLRANLKEALHVNVVQLSLVVYLIAMYCSVLGFNC